ncbi:MAG: RsmD family RNA methyltransferase [Chloroflexi bacterium]|nr:RsmD family RNA methyltransferase [Chloroflexota bacterium]
MRRWPPNWPRAGYSRWGPVRCWRSPQRPERPVAEAGRVVTGSAKGVRLLAPGPGTRPLSDRIKQALFGTLEVALAPAWPVAFLDLFAGSGAAGIEALSRGAPRTVFVERDPEAARVIAENLRRAGLSRGHLVRRDVLTVLAEGVAALDGPFGAVLVDPPYAERKALLATLARLGDLQLGWIGADAIVVAKHPWRDDPPERAGQLILERRKRFGETGLSYYRPDKSPEATVAR